MRTFKNKKTGDLYSLLAFATDATNNKNNEIVIVYCPKDNGNSIFVRNEQEFFENFEELSAKE